jgi:hypothetical protein
MNQNIPFLLQKRDTIWDTGLGFGVFCLWDDG